MEFFRNIGRSEERKQAAKEAAIASWENDPERNEEKLKVVRGADGLPVEIVTKSQYLAAFVVNKKEKVFRLTNLLHQNSLDDPIPSMCLDGVLKEGYVVEAVQRIDYGNKRKSLYVLTGTPTGLPPGLVETGRRTQFLNFSIKNPTVKKLVE